MRLTFYSLLLFANVALADVTAVDNRAMVALPYSGGGVYLSWRLFDTDSLNIGFNVYRNESGRLTKLNNSPLYSTTDFVDSAGSLDADVEYYVEVAGSGQRSKAALKPGNPDEPFLQFATGHGSHGRNLAVGDLMGRGQLDFVMRHSGVTIDPYYSLWRNSQTTYQLTAFDQTGKQLWEYDMGWAIEQGMWYSPFLVHDLDGDGRAEVIVKGGDETMGKAAMRDRTGRVMYGSEYVRILDGSDGKTVLAQSTWPGRHGFEGADPINTPLLDRKYEDYNRYSRNFLAIAYLDGVRPYVIASRGTYGKHKVVAYDYQNGQLKRLWGWENFDPELGGDITEWGRGAHTLHASDVDGDGRDEVIVGALVLDDDGSVLYSLNHHHKEHVDHVYVGDLDPSRPGKELYYGAEWQHDRKGIGMLDAATGEQIWAIDWPTTHIHSQGMCADIDADSPGIECFSGEENGSGQWLFSSDGEVLVDNGFSSLEPLAIWWDADVQKELLDHNKPPSPDVLTTISNYPARDRFHQLPAPADTRPHDLQYLRIIAAFDLFGDWREEVIVADRGRLLVYPSTIKADRRLPWLMSDHTYQMGVVSGSVGYYQLPMLDMSLKKPPAAVFSQSLPAGAASTASSIETQLTDAEDVRPVVEAELVDSPIIEVVPVTFEPAPSPLPVVTAPIRTIAPVSAEPSPVTVAPAPTGTRQPLPVTSVPTTTTTNTTTTAATPAANEAQSGASGWWSLLLLAGLAWRRRASAS